MIRSPLDKHERLQSRVEAAEKRNSDLEKRVKNLEDLLAYAGSAISPASVLEMGY